MENSVLVSDIGSQLLPVSVDGTPVGQSRVLHSPDRVVKYTKHQVSKESPHNVPFVDQ